MRPPRSSPPPDIIRYAVTSHWSCPLSRLRERPMVGSAVLTTEMSRTTRIWAVSATASTAHDRRVPLSSGSPEPVGAWGWMCAPACGSSCVSAGWRLTEVWLDMGGLLPGDRVMCSTLAGSVIARPGRMAGMHRRPVEPRPYAAGPIAWVLALTGGPQLLGGAGYERFRPEVVKRATRA